MRVLFPAIAITVFSNNDTSTDWNFVARARVSCCGQGLAHPMRVQFTLPSTRHDGNNRSNSGKFNYRWAA